jgi:hypothetical protein
MRRSSELQAPFLDKFKAVCRILPTAVRQIFAPREVEMSSPFEALQSNNSVVIAGHSHVVALTGRLLCPEFEVRKIDGSEHFYDFCGPWLRTQKYWDTLLTAPANTTVVLFWCGNEHHSAFLFRPTPLFDFVPANGFDYTLNQTAVIVPEALVRAKLGLNIGGLDWLLKTAKAHSSAKFVVAGTPPPKGDLMELRKLMKAEWFFTEQAKQLAVSLDDVELTPVEIQLKLWNVVQSLLRETAQAHDCEFIPVPDAAFNETGYLRRDMWADATHANAVYGKMMLAHLAERLRP